MLGHGPGLNEQVADQIDICGSSCDAMHDPSNLGPNIGHRPNSFHWALVVGSLPLSTQIRRVSFIEFKMT